MAIVKMDKIAIVGLNSEKRHIINHLMERGFVQIDDSSYLAEDEAFGGMLTRDSLEREVIEIEQKLSIINQSIGSIRSNVNVKKKSFLLPKDDFQSITPEQSEDYFQMAIEINVLYKDVESAKQLQNQLALTREMFIPWLPLDIPQGQLETKHTKTILGTFPIVVNMDLVRQKLSENAPESLAGVVSTDKQLIYAYVIAHKSAFDAASDTLKEFGFVPVSLSRTKGTPAQGIEEIDQHIKLNQTQRDELVEAITAYEEKLPLLENLYDYFLFKRDQRKAFEKLVKTKSAFCLTGWLPSKKAAGLQKELMEKYSCQVELEAGNEEEGFPVLLENNSIVTPFESVTNMYSTPSSSDVDPNSIMAFFYIIFFGMMLSDAGYGIIIAIACFLIVKKGKMKKGEGNLYKLLGICGISTTVWGLLFGGVFGDLLPIPAVINPLEDVMVLMGMSLLFGIIHIFVGLGIKAYNLIKHGHALDALFDIGFWYLFIIGVVLLILPVVAGPMAIAAYGKYLAIAGALGLVLTQGRSFKGIFTKGFKGVSSLYGITSYFADILSYSRLMALCLSTGVIGQVINLLGEIAGPIPAIFIGVIGHTANLLINALGAYVHTSRLQYVEFFGKFYEGGGVPFAPFKYKPKFTRINQNEN